MIFEGAPKIERRMSKKYMDVSPERVRVSTEKSPRYHLNHHCNNKRNSDHSSHHHHQQQQYSKNKVSVVYYLCKNQQLEHPHFMEVTLSSPDDGLYLRDVTEKLNALRGRGMASMYSWSCKRIYKNGFVWHDLCEDDLIVPARENEYVLKGSELFGQESSGKVSNNSTVLTEFKIRKSEDLSNASTQTEKEAKSGRPFQTQSTDCIECDTAEDCSTKDVRSEIFTEHISPPKASTSGDDSCSSGGAKTLESLIKADLRKQKNIKVLQHEKKRNMPSDAKVTASNIILQLISCGSLSAKDRNFGLIDKSRYLKIPTLLISGENQNPRVTGCMKSEEKECLSRISDSKCIPINKQPKCESTRSQFTEDRRISCDRSSMEAARV